MSDFSSIAPFYREKSLVQATAGRQLIELLEIAPTVDILDVGCGAGNLTAELRNITTGRVTGIDPAAGMINQARALYGSSGIDFRLAAADALPFDSEFDLIFCSSVFQWFRDPAPALAGFAQALRPGGRVGIQAPATSRYCPNFLAAITRCRRVPRLASLFAGFRPPWFFLEAAEEYRTLFEQAGFIVSHCRIAEAPRRCSVDKAIDIFSSGAAAGYLSPAYYAEPLPPDFAELVMAEVRAAFEEQAAASGEIELVFYRLFAVLRSGAGKMPDEQDSPSAIVKGII